MVITSFSTPILSLWIFHLTKNLRISISSCDKYCSDCTNSWTRAYVLFRSCTPRSTLNRQLALPFRHTKRLLCLVVWKVSPYLSSGSNWDLTIHIVSTILYLHMCYHNMCLMVFSIKVSKSIQITILYLSYSCYIPIWYKDIVYVWYE